MRHAAWVIPPLVLAAVLGLGARAKWGRGDSLRSVVANLELPAWVLPRQLAATIPGIELALVVGLLSPWRPAFLLAAIGSLVLLAVYWALIARGLTITPRPSCDCFGEVGNHEITGRTLLRNTLLVAAAASTTAVGASGDTAWSLMGRATEGDVLWLALAVLACGVTGLVLAGPTAPTSPQPAPATTRPDGTDTAVAGADADDEYARVPTPSALLHRPGRGPVTLHELSHSRAQLLIFVNCYCASTKEVMAAVEGWDARMALVDVRIVFSVPIAEKFVGPPPAGTLLDHAGLVWRALGLTRSPSAVLLGVDGHLAGGPVSGSDEVREFVDDVEGALREVAAADGDTAPVAPPSAPGAGATEPGVLTSDR